MTLIPRFPLCVLSQCFDNGSTDSVDLGRLQAQFLCCFRDPPHGLALAGGSTRQHELEQELPRRSLIGSQSVVSSHNPLLGQKQSCVDGSPV